MSYCTRTSHGFSQKQEAEPEIHGHLVSFQSHMVVTNTSFIGISYKHVHGPMGRVLVIFVVRCVIVNVQ